METILRKINEIKPYPKNSKKHDQTQIDNVAESIRQYGWAQPIVVDKDDVVIIGHCRLLAAQQLGLEEVPCVTMDKLTKKQANALRVIDNKSNESEWDFEFLAEELPDIDLSAFDFDFDISQEEDFNAEALEAMFKDAEEKEKEPKRIQCPHCGEWFEV